MKDPLSMLLPRLVPKPRHDFPWGPRFFIHWVPPLQFSWPRSLPAHPPMPWLQLELCFLTTRDPWLEWTNQDYCSVRPLENDPNPTICCPETSYIISYMLLNGHQPFFQSLSTSSRLWLCSWGVKASISRYWACSLLFPFPEIFKRESTMLETVNWR